VGTRKEYLEEIEARLGETEAQIEELMAQATRSDYDDYLTDIRAKQERAKAKLVELQGVNGESWLALRVQMDKAVSEVQNALFVATVDSG
jgi:hypothetical protein